ncbi:MAG TPA: signal peptidase II [Gaiellaceae bacterium]|nr:signal peptidase II [Gaiellaceae bacterium]
MQTERGTRLAKSRRSETEIRVGSATNGVVPQWGAGRSLAAGVWQWLGLAAVAGAAVAADQVTKWIVSSSLSLGESVDVVGPLSIHHVQNSGIAFGLFPTATAAVIVLTGVAVTWMLVFFARSGGRHPILPVALGLLLGGSVSNLADRVRLGHVTDFLDFRFWPAFNLADSFIVAGVAVLIGGLLLADREPRRARTINVSTNRP